MARTSVECPLCGERMREVVGQRATTKGIMEREWQCPRCLHVERTKERTRTE